MKRLIADSIMNAVSSYRQSLFIDEWNTIKSCVLGLVEDDDRESFDNKTHNKRSKSTQPPLVSFFNYLVKTKYETPIIVFFGVFIFGMLVGMYGI